MFKKGPDIDKKKLLAKASDVKKDSSTRLKHFKTLIEHLEQNEVPNLFKSHFSFIYHTFIDTFSTYDNNSKQRRDDLDSLLFMLEKILIYNPDLIKKRWQFYSITFVMQKLLHINNTWRVRQEGMRLFILWFQIVCDETSAELQTIFGSLVPGIVPQSSLQKLQQQLDLNKHQHSDHQIPHQRAQTLSASSPSTAPQEFSKNNTIEPLVPVSANEQLPSDETSFYLDSLLQFMVTQLAKPHWSSSSDGSRKNQELSFSFMFNMFKKIYLPHLFPDFNANISSNQAFYSDSSIHKYVDEMSSSCQLRGQKSPIVQNNNYTMISPTQTNKQYDTKMHSRNPSINSSIAVTQIAASQPVTHPNERFVSLSIMQSIVIRWLTRIMRQDSIPGQDEFIRASGGSTDRRETSSQSTETEFSQISDGNSTTIFQNMDSTCSEMEIARRVAGTWPENIVVVHELFRRAFLNYNQPASMKRVVNVYKEWICNGGPNQSNGNRTARIGYTSFSELLQVFVSNSSNAFVTKVHNQVMLDEQVEMCKRIMNIYRYMVMKIYMNTSTWEQLLNRMLSITKHLFPAVPPEKKEATIGGRIAPAFFQTFIVSWIRANLYVHISNEMWGEFQHTMKDLIRWRELIEEWSTTMSSLTRVLVKHVYGLTLNDLPLERPQERRRRPKALKSYSTAEIAPNATQKPESPAKKDNSTSESHDFSPDNRGQTQITSRDRSEPAARSSRSGSLKLASCLDHRDTQPNRLVRSNSEGILNRRTATKIYYSSLKAEIYSQTQSIRKIKSEHRFDACLDLSADGRSNSPSNHEVIGSASWKDPSVNICSDQVIDLSSNSHSKLSDSHKANISVTSSSLNGSQKADQPKQESLDKCVLLGGTIRGWTAENSVIMWRRMLGLFGNINHVEDPENHFIAMKCLAVILCDFVKTRENLGISLDNQLTPAQPKLIPPYTYNVGWLLEATHLPRQFEESRMIAYKLLCMMSIKRHDIELPPQYFSAFYEALHRGLCLPNPKIHVTIIKNSTQLLSLELPGSSFMVHSLYERSRTLLLSSPKELAITSSPKDQAVQLLSSVLSLYKPLRKLPVFKPEADNLLNLAPLGDMRTKVLETLLACNMRPVVLDHQTKSKSLCAVAIHVYQELCDKHDSPEVDRLLDTLLTNLQDSNNNELFRINCDLLRLFTEHAQLLAQTRPILVSSVIQIICQLLVRLSTSDQNKEQVHCLTFCLENWCISVGKNFLLKPLESLGRADDDCIGLTNEAPSVSLEAESLMTIVLRSLESVMNDEQFMDDASNKETRGSMSTSRGSDAFSTGRQSHLSSRTGDNISRDRVVGNDGNQSRHRYLHNLHKPDGKDKEESEHTKSIKLACKVSHLRLLTYVGHFPLKQVGAASMSSCVNESDYLNSSTESELDDFVTSNNLCLYVINESTVVSVIGGRTQSRLTTEQQVGMTQGQIHLIIRNLSGKYAWDASQVDLEIASESVGHGQSNRKDMIVVNPETFQQEESRASMRYYSDFNDDGNSSSSLSSRSSTYRDCIEDLINSLTVCSSATSSSTSSSSQNSSYQKKRNTALSVSNPRFKIAQAEETMIALLTNQRFQELNYCERPDDLDRIVLTLGSSRSRRPIIEKHDGRQHLYDRSSISTSTTTTKISDSETGLSNSHEVSHNLIENSFEHCRKLIQHLGYLCWEKRRKINLIGRSSKLLRELKNLDTQPGRETHKIAVIYVATGQEDKSSILTNSNGSRAFEDFVCALGWEVNLSSHLGFKGGLQSNKSTGETSIYYCDSSTEVMYHVSTKIPINGPADDESLNRKLRHLGNDEIHIVWSEHSRDYRQGIIPTEFGDVIIAIYPMLTFQNYYRIRIMCKNEVPIFGPLFDNCIVHQSSLAQLVRATAINASRAKRFKLSYYKSQFEERSRLIETIVKNYKEDLSFEDFALKLYQNPATPRGNETSRQDASCCA